jgi:hypothetical protein
MVSTATAQLAQPLGRLPSSFLRPLPNVAASVDAHSSPIDIDIDDFLSFDDDRGHHGP